MIADTALIDEMSAQVANGALTRPQALDEASKRGASSLTWWILNMRLAPFRTSVKEGEA